MHKMKVFEKVYLVVSKRLAYHMELLSELDFPENMFAAFCG